MATVIPNRTILDGLLGLLIVILALCIPAWCMWQVSGMLGFDTTFSQNLGLAGLIAILVLVGYIFTPKGD